MTAITLTAEQQTEYLAAATWCQQHGFTGEYGDLLPRGLSDPVRQAINASRAIFAGKIRDIREGRTPTLQPIVPAKHWTIASVKTPIVETMRQTARDLGIVDLLLTHRRIVASHPTEAAELIDTALIGLGATNAELVANLKGGQS